MDHPASNPSRLGFAGRPRSLISPAGGLVVYRCWGFRDAGVGSREWGTGYFSMVKPRSVLDAEVGFNLLNYDDQPGFGTNGINFVSTFRLLAGFAYWRGSIAGGIGDQIFVEAPLGPKMLLVKSREVLRHDAFVSARDGTA